MENILGNRIADLRSGMGVTQDQFGARYGVSGPAIFKFEKGYAKPSLDLWLKIARDCEISEKKAVLLWVKAKLPAEHQSYVDLSAAGVSEPIAEREQQVRYDYTNITDPVALRGRLSSNPALPRGIKELLANDEFWALYQPTGQEVQSLVEKFGSYAYAEMWLFRDAFRLLREAIRSESEYGAE